MTDIKNTDDKFESWKTADFIKAIRDLRDENAAKRIKIRELSDNVTELTSTRDELQSSLDTVTEELTGIKSTIDSGDMILKSVLDDAVKAHEIERDKLSNDVDTLKTGITKEKLLRTAYDMVHDADYSFRNKHERTGFESALLSKTDAGELKSEDDVKSEVESFLNDNYAAPPIPPAGPGVVRENNVASKVSDLMSKKGRLTPEEQATLRHLSGELKKK